MDRDTASRLRQVMARIGAADLQVRDEHGRPFWDGEWDWRDRVRLTLATASEAIHTLLCLKFGGDPDSAAGRG
jgi:hypothetical protein